MAVESGKFVNQCIYLFFWNKVVSFSKNFPGTFWEMRNEVILFYHDSVASFVSDTLRIILLFPLSLKKSYSFRAPFFFPPKKWSIKYRKTSLYWLSLLRDFITNKQQMVDHASGLASLDTVDDAVVVQGKRAEPTFSCVVVGPLPAGCVWCTLSRSRGRNAERVARLVPRFDDTWFGWEQQLATAVWFAVAKRVCDCLASANGPWLLRIYHHLPVIY